MGTTIFKPVSVLLSCCSKCLKMGEHCLDFEHIIMNLKAPEVNLKMDNISPANTASTEKPTEILQLTQALVILLTHLCSSSAAAPADSLFTDR